METKIPEWLGNGVSNTPKPVESPPPAKQQVSKKITLAKIKEEWGRCVIIDELDPAMVDWLISRVEQLEKRLEKHRQK